MTAAGRWRCVGLAMVGLGAALSGCVTPPHDSRSEPAPPSPVHAAAQPGGQTKPDSTLEQRHHDYALAYERQGNWADALVHWELLIILRPESAEYRDALAETRKRIRDTTESLMRAAEQARKQGSGDQAVLLYLRVLNVDRENTTAAQALRDLEAERTQRAYANRPPRRAM